MAKRELSEVKASIKAIREEASTVASATKRNEIATLVLNSDYEVSSFNNAGEETISVPSKTFRNEVAKASSKALKLDKNDTELLEENIEFNSRFAESFIATSDAINGEYLATGRKLNLTVPTKDSTKASIKMVNVAANTKEPTKIEKQEDGSYKTVSTGKIVDTADHTAIKVSNKVPDHLKTVTAKK